MTKDIFYHMLSLHSLEFVLRFIPRSVYALDKRDRIGIISEEQRKELYARVKALRSHNAH